MPNKIIVFNSTHQALKTEDRLRENGIFFDVIPLPKEFSADCGLAIEISADDAVAVQKMIKSYRITIKGIY